jgi:hypothetical protein
VSKKKCCTVTACAEKSARWWIITILAATLWLFMVIYELIGPGVDSKKVLINLGVTNNILPNIAAQMTAGLENTVEDWLDPYIDDPANATYCDHWSDCNAVEECWPIPSEITPMGEYSGICLCKSGSLMEGASCEIPSTRAAVWAWILFLGTITVIAFMAKDVIATLLILPKVRGKGKYMFESMDTVFYLLAAACFLAFIQTCLTLARSLGAGSRGSTAWTPYVYLPLADRAYISRCPRIETPGATSNNTFLVNDECEVDIGGNLMIDAFRSYYILMGDIAWILATIRWLNVGEASLSLKKASSDVGRLKAVFRIFGITYFVAVTVTWILASAVQGSSIAYEFAYIFIVLSQLFIQLTFLSTGIIFFKLGKKSDGNTSAIRKVMINVLIACGLQFVFISPLIDAFFDYPGYEITIDAEQGIDPPSGKDFATYMSNLSPDIPTSLAFRDDLFNYTVFNRILVTACPLVYIFALIRIIAPGVLARAQKTKPAAKVVSVNSKQGGVATKV